MIKMPGHFIQGPQVRNGEAEPCSEEVYAGREKRWEKCLKGLLKTGPSGTGGSLESGSKRARELPSPSPSCLCPSGGGPSSLAQISGLL